MLTANFRLLTILWIAVHLWCQRAENSSKLQGVLTQPVKPHGPRDAASSVIKAVFSFVLSPAALKIHSQPLDAALCIRLRKEIRAKGALTIAH